MTALFARKAFLPGGWHDAVRLEIEGGRYTAVVADASPRDGDTHCGCVIPGLGNAHSHAFQRALAGHTEQRSPAGRDNFWTWRERMYELAGRVDAAALRAIARQAYCEMLAAGYTSVAEFHYLHRDPGDPDREDAMFEAIAAAANDSGIRLCYVPVLYERAGFEAAGPSRAQRGFAMTVDAFLAHHARARAASGDRLTVGIGVHSLRAARAESLDAVVAAAADGPMHLHIAEQQREVDECLASYGRRPVRWLLDRHAVGPNWSLVHATHMDHDETEALAATGAVAVLCPSTEANLGDGLFPLHHYLESGGHIAIGSDSHVSINPFEELRWLEYGQRLATQTRNVVSLRGSHVGRELFERALDGGALATGQRDTGIQKGAPADLLVLSDDDPMLVGHDDRSRLDALVFSGYPLPVERVMVAGAWHVEEMMHVDRERTRRDYAAAIMRVGSAR